jgi:limonene-1,2-epoxide hydrolase
MPTGLLPNAAPPDGDVTDPQTVAEAFMEALAASDLDRALSYLDDDVVYSNVGLPTIRGRDRVARVFRGLDGSSGAFEVYLHAVSADGPVVLTERTDVIVVGPFRAQFWVWGRFDVHDGCITLWRDSFDFLAITRATVRGFAGIVVPALRPTAPAPGDAPGR